jgi:hypothetical protein
MPQLPQHASRSQSQFLFLGRLEDLGCRVVWKQISSAKLQVGKPKMHKTLDLRSQNALPRAAHPSWPYLFIISRVFGLPNLGSPGPLVFFFVSIFFLFKTFFRCPFLPGVLLRILFLLSFSCLASHYVKEMDAANTFKCALGIHFCQIQFWKPKYMLFLFYSAVFCRVA